MLYFFRGMFLLSFPFSFSWQSVVSSDFSSFLFFSFFFFFFFFLGIVVVLHFFGFNCLFYASYAFSGCPWLVVLRLG